MDQRECTSPGHCGSDDEEAQDTGRPSEITETKQRLLVMRHGERLDTLNRDWKKTATRPYDTPLTPRGRRAVFTLAKERFAGKDIRVVYSSPFLRCMQTAHQVCAALEMPGMHTHNGLAEILSPECGMHAGPPDVPALADVQSYGIKLLTIDRSQFGWPEEVHHALTRYESAFSDLASQHWPESLLLVTHEYGVIKAMAVGGCKDDVEATYCGHVVLSRSSITEQWTIDHYHGVYKYDNVF